MKEDFEYHVTYPKGARQREKVDDCPPTTADERLPVVLLFGWAGCEDKHLAKYSKIYEDQGLITLRYIAPVPFLLWKRSRMIPSTEKLVDSLFDLHFDEHPLFIHCFSNGGAFICQHFSAAISKRAQRLNVKGVIFDSAPGKRSNFIRLYRAFSTVFGGHWLVNAVKSILSLMIYAVIWACEEVLIFCAGALYFKTDPFEHLKMDRFRWPQHFIYSKADLLISYQEIEEFYRFRKAQGVDVTYLRYETSPHVKHFIENPDSYTSSVKEFLEKCLRVSPM